MTFWCGWHVTSAIVRSWCATWFALTRHGGLDGVGSFGSFLIVFHALQLVCVMLVNVMTFSYLFPPSFCQSVCFQILWFRVKRVALVCFI